MSNVPELHLPSGTIPKRSTPGFCDALVAQIDQSLVDAKLDEGACCTLTFGNGAKPVVPLAGDAVRGPEALELPGMWLVFNP